jgi:xanthine/uracil permease
MKVPPVVIELFKRIASDNPSFFKWIQTISAVVAVVAFIPDLLAFLDIAAPSWLDVLHDKTVKVGALTAIIMAQLPNEQKK